MFRNDTFQQIVLPILTQCTVLTFSNDESFFIPNPYPEDTPQIKIVFQNTVELFRRSAEAHKMMNSWSPEELQEKYDAVRFMIYDILNDEYFGRAMKRRSIAFTWCRSLYLTLIVEERVTNPKRGVPPSPIKIDPELSTIIMTAIIHDLRSLIAKHKMIVTVEMVAEARRVKDETNLFLKARMLDDSRTITREQHEMLEIIYELFIVVTRFFEKSSVISRILKEDRAIPSVFDLDTALELTKIEKNVLFHSLAERLTIKAIGGVNVYSKNSNCYIHTTVGCFHIGTYECNYNRTLDVGYSYTYAVIKKNKG